MRHQHNCKIDILQIKVQHIPSKLQTQIVCKKSPIMTIDLLNLPQDFGWLHSCRFQLEPGKELPEVPFFLELFQEE